MLEVRENWGEKSYFVNNLPVVKNAHSMVLVRLPDGIEQWMPISWKPLRHTIYDQGQRYEVSTEQLNVLFDYHRLELEIAIDGLTILDLR